MTAGSVLALTLAFLRPRAHELNAPAGDDEGLEAVRVQVLGVWFALLCVASRVSSLAPDADRLARVAQAEALGFQGAWVGWRPVWGRGLTLFEWLAGRRVLPWKKPPNA